MNIQSNIPDIQRIAGLLVKHNGAACGGNWSAMLYSAYKDIVGVEPAERAWDIMDAADINKEHAGVSEFVYWAELINCIATEIQQSITPYPREEKRFVIGRCYWHTGLYGPGWLDKVIDRTKDTVTLCQSGYERDTTDYRSYEILKDTDETEMCECWEYRETKCYIMANDNM